MQQLYFVRHGETEWNAIRRMQGQLNSNLNSRGRSQAADHGKLLATQDIEAMFVSPLDRTRQTANIIQQHVPLEASVDERLKEWDCGDWSGHLYDEIRQRWAEEWRAWQTDRFHYRGPGCENYPDMIARATPFIEQLLEHPAQRIAIVSHGMIGRVMISIVMGFGAQEMLSFTQDNDVIYRVQVPNSAAQPRQVEHFVAGKGPHPGVVARG